ncbi:MAG: gliding motility-associated C-terminal domain-containing protein [Burkholderiales bacterium]|nr:gliding motility-associated C-terminal domain-containing protein [Bacteroidia bacterium]
MVKKLLLFIVLLTAGYVNAQTLYWVGGSGHWNDIHHWSYSSGGAAVNRAPDLNTDVIFDNNSSSNTFLVAFTGLSYVKSINILNQNNDLHFTGSNLSSLECSGNFVLNDKTFFDANTSLVFSSASTQYNDVNFWRNSFKANVLFEKGNWNLQSVKLADNYLLKINKGNYKVNNASVVVWDMESASDLVNFQINHATFYVKNRFTLGDQVSFNSSDLTLIAQKNNPNLYRIDPNVDFGLNNKIFGTNPTPLACTITYSFTNPSCFGSCDGSITVGFDPSCTTGPYDLLFNNSSSCFPTGANGVVPPSFSLNGICSCGGLLDIFVFDAIGFVTQLTSLPTPQDPTPLGLFFSGPKQPRCFGLCDGSVNIFTSGGSPPYNITVLSAPSGSTVGTYTNVPAVTTTTITNLCAGTFSFVVKDNKNCTKTFTTVMIQPTAVNPNASPTQITCNGVCNGSVSTTSSGGVGPYTYSWISGTSTPSTSTTSTIGSLCPGVVTMTVTDSKTCTATFSTTITQPPAVTLTVNKTNLICGSLCNGSASVTATGGVPGTFTYTWAPSGGNGPTASNLCAGNYTVTVTNNGNCVKTITFAITSPPILTATPTQTNLACNGACIGAINLNPSGGTGNPTYTWSPAAPTSSLITGLCAGVYSYTITDAAFCKYSNSVTITQPSATTLIMTKTDVTCNGVCNGTATGNMSGGTLPYTYSWTPAAPSASVITNLCPGTYTLKVTDFKGCSKTNTVTIFQPTVISVNVTSVSPTCNGLCNGSINSLPSGGTGPYTFTLQSSGAPVTSNPPYTNLCAGSYTVIVKDVAGCIKTQAVNLLQPNPVVLTLTPTQNTCFNQCNATISTLVNGGTPLFTYLWSTGATGSSLSNLCSGVYSATVTDANGCKGSASITITSPPDLTVTIVPTNPNCNAQCTGIATASALGGTPNYTLNWNNGAVGNIISNLCQGVYTATVTDFNGCIKIQTVSITPPPAITLTATNGTVSCAGSCDGTVSVTPTGGTPGYFYSWSPTAPTQTNSIANGLCGGNYIASVTDSKGCIASIAASVAQPTVLTASIGNVQPSCNICIGAATAAGIGGTPPYTYSWSAGQTIPNPSNLCVGVQTVIVTDSKGCTTTQTVQINQTVITLITTNGNTLSCNGGCTGVATANPSGGAGGFTYTWTPAPVAPIQNTPTATGLCAGTHTVKVSDINGCSSTNTISFTNPPVITLTISQTNVNCSGLCNGTASATAIGGTGAMSYLWSTGAVTPSINGLCAGSYTVTATDINNCTKSQVITIIENSLLTATFTPVNPSTCTSSDGSITAAISGGLPTYTLTWMPGLQTVNTLTNIAAGSYTLNIMDAAGCTQTISTTLSNPTGPTVTAVSNSITCFGACNGSATLTIAGTGPFSVNGSTIAANTATLSGLCAGITTPIIVDANSCITNQPINISEPALLTVNGVVSDDPCNASCTGSINLTPTGGTLPYTYSWLPAGGSVPDPVNLCAGNYTVNITDGNLCVVSNTFVITQPPALTLSFNKKDVLCNGVCTGGVRAIVGGGSSPYTYTWTAAAPFVTANIDTLVNLCSGNYSVTAADANGCIISGTINIGQPVALTATITSVNVKCNGQCNGSATITASGGTGTYSYNYNTTPITPTQTIGGLCVGSYTGNVGDANGCKASASFSITEPLPIVVTTTISNPKCNAVCNGSVATTVTGGSPAYSYNWIPNGGPVPNPTGLCAGNYTLIVTDDSLCIGQALVVLTNPAALIANTSFTNPTCNGGCNGAVSATPIGGTFPFNYSWASPVFTTQTVPNLCAGNYTVTVSDANSCQSIQMVTLTNPPAITINPALAPATCSVSNGSINAIASGGTPNYTYNWLNPVIVLSGQTTNTLVTGIPAGIYTVVVTDASGCSTTSVIPLSNSNGPAGATITSTNVTCQGLCNGSAQVSNPVVGGTPPYVLSWINPSSASTLVSGLCAGTYTTRILDANNCVFFQPVSIVEPQNIDDNEIITGAACLGNCNGSIALNPSGGNGGYTYAWSPVAAINGTVTSLCPGVHTATITDVLGCTLVSNYNLPSITTITSSTFATNNSCFGNCNGTLLATNVAGGVPNYSYSWSGSGQSTPLATGLCNGNYSVTITDVNGCYNVFPAVITSPSAVTFTPTVTQPNCGLCDGAVVLNPVGGTPGYTYVWSGGIPAGNSASNLCAGVYMVQVTDGNGCKSNTNVVVNNSSTITETITLKNVSCGGVCDGTVTVTAIGGTGVISYNWLHTSLNSPTLVGLCAGTYFCNMTDANGCTRTASVVIGATTTLTITPQITQSSCSSATASITVSVAGGTASYTYAWLPAGNTATLTNLAPGNYTLTVSDGNCTQTQIYSINSINGPAVTFTTQNVSCSGTCDGSISLTVSGGTPTYTTTWSNGAVTQNISGLCAGPYSYTITDAAGCKALQSFSLNTLPPIVFSIPDINNPTCNNNCNGVVTTIPSGGVLPYTYSWIVSTATTNIANGLCSGNYSVTVSDANGCSAQEGYTLTGPSSITVTAVISNLICNAVATGSIDLTVAGGTPGYTYTWTPGSVFTQDISNVLAGVHSVTITDANGCVVDSSFTITQPTAINDNEVISSSACFGNCTGSVSLTPTGGSGSYSYTWTTGASTGTVTSLCPGPLTSTITDSQGCTLVSNYNVPSITTITANTLAVNNNCFSDCNGVLTATNVAGGLPPFTLQWNDPLGQPGNVAIGLCTGTYSVKITDANGCFNMIPATIIAPSQVTFTPNITAPGCDLCNGSAIVNPVGGTSGYTYIWTNNQTGNTATNLCAGAYGIRITDGNGCVNTTTVVINSASGITGETVTFTDVTCGGTCDGTASIAAVGGVPPISYSWLNGSTSQSLTGLCAGTYFCNMTDANGCSRTASVVIGAATTLTVSSQVTQSSCSANTGSITVIVTGGAGGYSYAWVPAAPNTPTVTNLAPGVYTLTVSDGNCSKTQVFTVQSFSAPVITSTKKDISCSNICDGNIAITISGGVPTVNTLWSNGSTTNTISALCAGSYSVKVTDGAGCIAIRNFSLSTVSPIVFSAPDLDNPLCNNACDGSLTVIPVGGALPYTYSWTPTNVTTASTNSLCAGNYSITVKDANGCPATNSYSLVSPPAITLTATITDATCSSAPDGAITTTVSGGTPGPGYATVWMPGNSSSLINVLSGSYTVTVTDFAGCMLDSAFTIKSIITVNALAGNDTLFCQNGTLLLDGSNSSGDPGTTYQWLSLPSNTVVAGTLITTVSPATGTSTFVLVATDASGFCIDRDSIVITSNALPNVDAGPMVSIPLFSSAQIGGSPTGPSGSTFSWTPVVALDNPSNSNPTSGTTVTTIYTVTVMDANGCSNFDTVTVFVYPEVNIPNGFSPNADGKNDVWQIDFIDQFPNCEVEVYNRWGERLFYSKGYTVPFNGQYKGKDLPVGTYYYIINLNHPSHPDAYTSPLTIFR